MAIVEGGNSKGGESKGGESRTAASTAIRWQATARATAESKEVTAATMDGIESDGRAKPSYGGDLAATAAMMALSIWSHNGRVQSKAIMAIMCNCAMTESGDYG